MLLFACGMWCGPGSELDFWHQSVHTWPHSANAASLPSQGKEPVPARFEERERQKREREKRDTRDASSSTMHAAVAITPPVGCLPPAALSLRVCSTAVVYQLKVAISSSKHGVLCFFFSLLIFFLIVSFPPLALLLGSRMMGTIWNGSKLRAKAKSACRPRQRTSSHKLRRVRRGIPFLWMPVP